MTNRRNKLGVAVCAAMFAVALSACGGGGGGGGGSAVDNWNETTGKTDTVHRYVDPGDPAVGCEVAPLNLIVKGDFYDQVYAYSWWGEQKLFGEWAGTEASRLDTCPTATIYTVPLPEEYDPKGAYQVIVNNGPDNGKQTGDGNFYSESMPCLLMTSESEAHFVPARECGVAVEGEEFNDSSYIYNAKNDTILQDGATIEINQVDGAADSESVNISLLMAGPGVTAQTQGKYWIGDVHFDDAAVQDTDDSNDPEGGVPFVNGEIISLGKNVIVDEGQKKSTKLTVKYNDAVSVFNVVKTYTKKDAACRLEKSEETLGAIYSSDKTVFRIWYPGSSKVSVNVDGTDYEMKLANVKCYTSVYEVTVEGDLDGKKYQFSIDGVPVRDPYGKMIASDGIDNTANIVMDMSKTDPEGGWAAAPELKNRVDSIVYEVHVRDFTIDETSNVDKNKRGRYLGMVQSGTTYKGVTTGIDHLKELGITHVQLQPIYDYATCSDVDSQDSSCYNWGYDPWNYNVPETRYSSAFGTADYNTKISEVKTMINEFHKNGIRVIMDVVYNHTYNNSVFDKISGKYYLKTD
ncbi:MAG: hypothetical protein II161_05105, partial [Erysipelotrichaceae bacterium]|nr:hypothetical protein [Erysipelotrichaceae bacterium]